MLPDAEDKYLVSLVCSCPFKSHRDACVVQPYRNGQTPDQIYKMVRDLHISTKNDLVQKHEACFSKRNGEYLYKRKYSIANMNNGLGLDERKKLLTKREREVIKLIADGKDGAAIAKELKIKPGTFKNHKTSIYEKLQVNNKVEFLWKVIGLDMYK